MTVWGSAGQVCRTSLHWIRAMSCHGWTGPMASGAEPQGAVRFPLPYGGPAVNVTYCCAADLGHLAEVLVARCVRRVTPPTSPRANPWMQTGEHSAHSRGGGMPPSLTLRSSPVGSQNGPEGAGGTGSRKRPSRAGGGERAPTPPPSAAAAGLPGCGCQETPRAPALWVSPRGPGGQPGGGRMSPSSAPGVTQHSLLEHAGIVTLFADRRPRGTVWGPGWVEPPESKPQAPGCD